MLVALLTVTLVAESPPKNTTAGFANPVPVIVTSVPPVDGPVLGEIPLTVGAAPKVNCWGAVPLPFGVVTTTLNEPVPWAGVVTVSDLPPGATVTAVPAVPPNVTDVVPATKPVPVMVTLVPPDAGPCAGAIAVTVGAGVAAIV